MKHPLWKFNADDGTFSSSRAHTVSTLYLPLANEQLMSSITPTLQGDIKTGQDHFLLEPVSRIDLVNSRASRNFWVYRTPDLIWSATGVSKDRKLASGDRCTMNGGLLWQEVQRSNKRVGLKAAILSFVPSTGEPVEIMRVTLTNISSHSVTFTPTAAIPLYARGAQSIRDHRHVTSLLQRITLHPYGIITKPTLHFDERGHAPNTMMYGVSGWDEKGRAPHALYPTQEIFCGESGDLEAPEALLDNRPADSHPIQGREPMGALRFAPKTLRPRQSCTYIIVMGIADSLQVFGRVRRSFNTVDKVHASWDQTRRHWVDKARQIRIQSGVTAYDNWFQWVAIQPTLRRIYGCSFLPDFDYGKGGRGWRDLWQDCLGLILSDPAPVRRVLLNNFSGVKIDGSNATIIGRKPGEFIADRNHISRVWMDHGAWPLLTLNLYMHETGDTALLFEKAGYFRDGHGHRGKQQDRTWDLSQKPVLKTKTGRIYSGSILEHLLVQNLVPFFNVGAHNCILLEGADWNDGLDMAQQRGESVAFSCLYAHNLNLLADILENAGVSAVTVAREIGLLLKPCNYASRNAKQAILTAYFQKVQPHISGVCIPLNTAELIADLRKKAAWLTQHIRRQEWLSEGFFNGYYDNLSRRVEGKRKAGMRMMLASQVFPIMSGVADDRQLQRMISSVRRYLRDRTSGGIHLNTDFKEEQHHLGRAFSFIYGDKENGAYFNHMIIMYAYALYTRGYAREGWQVLSSIFDMAVNTDKSKIFPCLPEYFDATGRGMYAYLTGSASWYVLTVLTQVFGVRGEQGDLCIEPKFSPVQYSTQKEITLSRRFAGRSFTIRFYNSSKHSSGEPVIRQALLNGKPVLLTAHQGIRIKRSLIQALKRHTTHTIEVILDTI